MIKDGLVSVITPMYNSEKFIKEMITSVIDQNYTNWELIIVDDCSSDSSCQIVDEYLKKDPRIKLIKHIENSGPAQARNTAIENSTGEFIAFLDSDDIWMKNKLNLQVNVMREKKVAISCTGYEIYSSDLTVKYGDFSVPEDIEYSDLLKLNYFSCDTVMINKRMLTDIKMTTSPMHEDYVAWLNFMKQAEKAIGINEPLAIYRLSDNSRSSNKIRGIFERFLIFKNIEHLGLFKSCYYSCIYTIKGFLKYKKKLIS